ncbi:MAG: aspartyl protease family protein [Acidobacteria bacterium]|nr:aspartyl protease family protein [Acidobacteriota bacterium]
MRFASRSMVFAAAAAVAVPIVIDAQSTPASARSETRLQLADLLHGDQRYWEAIRAFDLAKEGATPEQLVRATSGSLRSSLQVAEFTQSFNEALALRRLAPGDPAAMSLVGDALWASGLFDEAEAVYRDVLALDAGSGSGRHGLARSIATRQGFEEALNWARAALEASPNEAAFHHTLGSIYQQMHRYREAADAYERYISLLPVATNTEKSSWARNDVQFLRSFGDRPVVQLANPGQVHTIPFRLERDKVIVRGRVNGRDPVDFVVDTGAEQTVLSQTVARALGVEPITNTLSAGVGEEGLRGLQTARLDSLSIGSFEVANLPAIIKSPPLGGLPTPEAEGFSPLALGLSVIIDYGRQELHIGEALPDEAADITLPMRQHRLAVVRGVVNGEYPRSFIVDTGGQVISISRGTASLLPPLTVRQVPVKVYGTSGWDNDAYLRPGTDLAFDQLLYRNYSVVVLNLHRPSALLGFQIGGIVGYSFLKDYRVTLDLGRSVMKLNRI